MDMTEILSDALVYPFNNIKALIIYLVLGIVAGIAIAGTIGAISAGAFYKNVFAVIGSGILGIIVSLFIIFVIGGYELDIIKYGIDRDSGAPDVDFIRQFVNGIKFFIVNIVYYIIPVIIGSILAVIFQHWLSGLITLIITIIFAFAAVMGQCRLAKTEDLVHALAIGEAIGDISRVGVVNLVVLVVVIFIVAFVLIMIAGLISQWNSIVGGILMGIVGVYITFFFARSLGLLYSNV